MFSYVRWVADGDRNGFIEEPIYATETVEMEPGGFSCLGCGAEFTEPTSYTNEFGEAVTACPECGSNALEERPPVTEEIPKQVDVKVYPKGNVALTLTNSTRLRYQLFAESTDDTEYIIYEYEESKSKLLAMYPRLRQKLRDRSQTTNQSEEKARAVRAALASPGGSSSQRSMPTFTRAWFKNTLFELIEDDAKRDFFKQNFPKGCKATLADGFLMDIEGENLSDHWTDCPAETSDTIVTDPICNDMIDVQDAINDSLTIGMETILRGLPLTIVSADVVDENMLRDKPATPAELLVAKPTAGTNIANAIAPLHTAHFPAEMQPFIASFQSEAREATGVLPQIWGGGDGSVTATEYSKRQNQALAQLGMQWLYMRRFWVKTMFKAVKILANHAAFEIVAPTESKATADTDIIDVQAIGSGNFYFESDESIPQSWGQQKEQLLYLIGQAPQIAELLGVTNPTNIQQIRDLLGLPMLRTPGETYRQKTLNAITELLKGSPVEGPDGLEPSVPIDEFEDDPSVSVEVVKTFLAEPSGQRARRENPSGYENVKAYGMKLFRLLNPPPPPQGGPAPPGGEPPPSAAPAPQPQ
jgi:DNA-directed RNA polymerase subunit RPC12/RpoP